MWIPGPVSCICTIARCEPVQPAGSAAQRVPDVEQETDQRGHPRKRPSLTLIPAIGSQTQVQRGPHVTCSTQEMREPHSCTWEG
jgi:hypothetical protein